MGAGGSIIADPRHMNAALRLGTDVEHSGNIELVAQEAKRMSEVADLPYRIVNARGEEYYVSVAGEPGAMGGGRPGWNTSPPTNLTRCSRLPRRPRPPVPTSFGGRRR